MVKSTGNNAQALIHSLRAAYAATPTNLKVCISTSVEFVFPLCYHKM